VTIAHFLKKNIENSAVTANKMLVLFTAEERTLANDIDNT